MDTRNLTIVAEWAAGIDVHKDSIVVCVSTPHVHETRTFGTMTGDLRRMVEWLLACRVTAVAMESTGPYWWPVYNALEEAPDLEIRVVNPQHAKALPGRKTDVSDAAWLCKLLRYDLVQGSFIPDKDQRHLREVARYRKKIIQERATEINRVQKTLESANIKLGSVASDVLGVSGRQMLEAMIAGVTDPKALAAMARGRLRKKQDELALALEGLVGSHHRFILKEQLGHIDELDARIARLDADIEVRVRPFERALELLDTVPGVGRRAAEMIVAEIGVDMGRFPSADCLSSWGGVCPGNNESAGKRKSGRTRKGDGWLRATLVECAHSAARTRGTYLNAHYHRLVHSRGKKRAMVALAHSILVSIYHMLKNGTTYQDLGGDYFTQRRKDDEISRLTKRLQALGARVTIESVA